jgi:beta-lactamase regulating signal transducer with metallopeptidase domain
MTSEFLGKLWVVLGTHLWQTSLVLVVLFAVARVMRRAPAGFLNSLLWIGLAKLFIPLPLLKDLVGGAVDATIRTASSAGIAVKTAVPLLEGTAAVLDPVRAVLGTDRLLTDGLPVTLTALWAAGAVIMVTVWLLNARPRKRPETVPMSEAPSELHRRLAAALRDANVPESAVLVTGSRIVPYVAGLLRPRIIIPLKLLERIDDTALKGILLHEDAHGRRREPLRLLLSRVAAVTFFFYPLLWPLLRRIRETGEMACDDAALAGGIHPGAYARALASVLDMELTAAPSGAALDRRSPSLMRRRLTRLNEPGRYTMQVRHRAVLSLAVVCVLLSSVLSLSSSAGDVTTDAKAPPPAEKPTPLPMEEPPPPEKPAKPAPVPAEYFISKMVPPKYPDLARQEGLEAIVFVEITVGDDMAVNSAELKTVIVGRPPLEVVKIDEDGKVVEPVEEEGMDAYHEVFTQAALEAALQWEIEVRPEGTQTDSTTLVVPIQFRLNGDKTD